VNIKHLLFEDLTDTVIESEGGWVYSDHPDDPDQGTYAGVRYVTHCNFMRAENYVPLSAAEFRDCAQEDDPDLRESVYRIYRQYYWDVIRMDTLIHVLTTLKLPLIDNSIPRLLLGMYSCAINLGPNPAIRFFQEAINTIPGADAGEEDGLMGAKTQTGFVNALQEGPKLVEKYEYFWRRYYNELVQGNSEAWSAYTERLQAILPNERDALANQSVSDIATALGIEPPKLKRFRFLKGWHNRVSEALSLGK